MAIATAVRTEALITPHSTHSTAALGAFNLERFLLRLRPPTIKNGPMDPFEYIECLGVLAFEVPSELIAKLSKLILFPRWHLKQRRVLVGQASLYELSLG
jgi:hypothetical protein